MTDFFINDLVPSLLGDETADPTRRARRFISTEVIESVEAIRAAFHGSGQVKHVALQDVTRAPLCDGIHRGLRAARFQRHHHAAYRIEISPLDALKPSPLRTFCRWLKSDDAARFHGWLVGWPDDGRVLKTRQVQVARARRGDEFPVHIDTDEEGLAVVYNFTRDFGPDDGGTLYFPSRRAKELVRLAPTFNTVMVFRPRDAPHGVSEITGTGTRFTVTSFFCAP